MSAADELLATLSVDYTDEPYITVNDDRTITIPDELKHIAVERDHNVETVTFDCPRYWDEHDFSTMKVYINYQRPDGYKDSCPVKNLRIADDDDTRILFDWTISANVTQIMGALSFLVYIEDSDTNPCWHSRLNRQMIIDEGLTCVTQGEILPDSIEALLSTRIAAQLDHVKTQIDAKAAEALSSIPEDYTTTYNLANEAVRTKADAVVCSASGDLIKLTDCSNDYIRSLSAFGKTTQVSTTGKNLWDNASAYMPHTDVITRTETGFSFVRGDNAGGFYVSYNIPISAGQTITFSADGSAYNPTLIIYSDAVYGTLVKSGTRVLTYTSTSAISSAVFTIVINSTDGDNDITNIQVEVSSDRTAYEPYSGGFISPSPDWPQTPVGIENPRLGIAGGNLFDANRITSVSKGGATITNNGDGSFFINGAGNVSEICSTEYSITNEEMKLLFHPGTLRLITDVQTNPIVFVNLYKNGSFMSTILSSTWARDYSYTLTDEHFESDTYSLRIGFHANADTTIIPGTVTPILTQFSGDVQSAYQGYVVASRAVPCVLHGIPVSSGGNYTDPNGQQWICDEIDFARGVYIQRVAVKTLDGSIAYQEAGTQTEGTYTAFVSYTDIWNNENDPYISDRFVGYPGSDYRTSTLEGIYTNPGVTHCNLIILRINKNRLDTTTYEPLEAMQVFLQDNPVTVYAPLLKPIETELTAEEITKLSSFTTLHPYTTILNAVGAGMSITYNADTKTYVDNLDSVGADLSPASADNSAALLKAIAEATVKGVAVHIPAGTYVFKTPITLPDGVTVEIVGTSDAFANSMNREKVGAEYHAKANGTILIYRGEGAMFRHQSCVFKFKDLSLVSQSASKNYLYTARLVGQTTVDSSTKGKIYAENCLFAGWKTIAGDPFVTDDLETALGGTLAKPETLEQCSVVASRCRFSFCGSAINMGVDSRLEDCAINKCYYGATFYGAAGFSTLANCRIEWCTYDGVLANQAHDIMITGCEFDRCGYAAVRYQACTGSSIIGNTMRRSGSDSSLTADAATKNTHLYVYGCSGGVIANNITVKKNIMDDGSSTVVRPVNAYNFQNCDSIVVMANDFNGRTTGTYNRYTNSTNCRVLGNLGLTDEA